MQSEKDSNISRLSFEELESVNKVFNQYFSSQFEEVKKESGVGSDNKLEKKNDSGIKLFLSSPSSCSADPPVKQQINLKRRKLSESSSSDDDERFAEAAISGSMIVAQSACLQQIPTLQETTDAGLNGEHERKKLKKSKKKKKEKSKKHSE